MPSIDPGLPGADIVAAGVEDLRAGRETESSLLVEMAAPRLRALGLSVPAGGSGRPSHRLYDRLASEDPLAAHSRFNALVRRVVSFVQAADHARPR